MKKLSLYSVSMLFYLFIMPGSTEHVSNSANEASKDKHLEIKSTSEREANIFSIALPAPTTDTIIFNGRNPIFELCVQRCGGSSYILQNDWCVSQCVQYYYFFLRRKF